MTLRRPAFRAAVAALACAFAAARGSSPAASAPAEEDRVPAFSLEYLDRSVSPRTNFFLFANGTWVRENPVPSNKARWTAIDELAERNWRLIRNILETAAADRDAAPKSPTRLVGDFFRSALDTNRLELLQFRPIQADLKAVDEIGGPSDAARLVADWHRRAIDTAFSISVEPDAKDSSVYALYLGQGGLGLPDRDYYLADGFASQRDEYRNHVARMLVQLGDSSADAEAAADSILRLETELARASRSRTDLRDPDKNYNPHTYDELRRLTPALDWDTYFETLGVRPPPRLIVGQPEFFTALNQLSEEASGETWRAYLRWHLVRSCAPFLHEAAAGENFRFYGTVLQGQPEPEPRWQRAARVIDGGFSHTGLGEALGQIYVEKHFPPEARARMLQLVEDLKAVFRGRLEKLDWMSPETREKALQKFSRFTAKIGHPPAFRDYSTVDIRPDDYLGNRQRAAAANFDRELRRVGRPVDRDEWFMTPQTVNAYFDPSLNQIVFPAGILQPPFFDLSMDDAVNYGAIGGVIGHEITHGYDDQGRKFDADGNLNSWWSDADAREFEARARKLVEQYGAYEPLPGARVNGQLTLGENIADLGGVSIAFEALQRALERDPSRRRTIGGFTPEQRFFLAWAQVWRVNAREAEIRRRLVVDSHAPPRFRAFGPLVNLPQFHEAFGIRPGDPMWKSPEERAVIW